MAPTLAGWLVGFVLGLRHALEPDHLGAISTFLADERRGARALLVGTFWGVGHAVALLVLGGALLCLRVSLPNWFADLLDLVVAAMLVVLGGRGLVTALRQGRTGLHHGHRHGTTRHVHAGSADHVHLAGWALAPRPLVVGVVHGLAGSGALTALVLAEMRDVTSGLLYMALFGIGSTVGMSLMTGLAGLSLARIGADRALRVWIMGAGALSIGLGITWGLPLVEKLAIGG